MTTAKNKASTKEAEQEIIIMDDDIQDAPEAQEMALVPKEENKDITTASTAPQGPGTLLSVIERVSQMPDLNTEKMDQIERLFGMHQQMMDREAEQQFNDALAAAQKEIESVAVNKSSDKGKYADLNAIHAAAKPIWAKHGLSVITKSRPSDVAGCVTVFGELRHAGGHKEPFEMDWPIDDKTLTGKDNKTPIQALGSTITYARRYTECMLFDIAIQGEDKDGAGPAQELSTKAGDWIAKVNESVSLADLEANFKEGYKDLNGDGFGRNSLIKAKDATKKKLQGAG